MKLLKILLLLTFASYQAYSGYAVVEVEKISYSFEDGPEGWIIPEWALSNEDYSAIDLVTSNEQASDGIGSLRLNCDFPGNIWKAALIELPRDFDLTGYEFISMDIFLPKIARTNLINARIVIGAGDLPFIESKLTKKLRPGKWTTIKARLDVDEKGQLSYWKCQSKEECLVPYMSKVNTLSLRIEYNANQSLAGNPYKGPIYVDNVVLG